MILLGDIGNTDIKISLYSNYKKLILKKRINPLLLNFNKLNFHLSFLKKKVKYFYTMIILPNLKL